MIRALAAPRVAWPTLAVFAAAIATWCLALVTSSCFGVVLATCAAYVVFTPLHEAAHRSLARAGWVNEVVGRVAGVVLFAPFPAVRDLHLEHHKHTNDADADPDHWSGRGPAWLLPVRWLTQDLHYYVVYARRQRPWRERIEVVATLVVFVATASVLVARGHGHAVAFGWLVPARVAVGVLAFAFDYLPHRPHRVRAREDRYAATSATEGRAWYVLSLGQSLHRVHHFYPGVPFYRYARVWRDVPAARGRM